MTPKDKKQNVKESIRRVIRPNSLSKNDVIGLFDRIENYLSTQNDWLVNKNRPAYVDFQPYYKDFCILHHIDGLDLQSIAIYNYIHNLAQKQIYLNFRQESYQRSLDEKKNNKTSKTSITSKKTLSELSNGKDKDKNFHKEDKSENKNPYKSENKNPYKSENKNPYKSENKNPVDLSKYDLTNVTVKLTLDELSEHINISKSTITRSLPVLFRYGLLEYSGKTNNREYRILFDVEKLHFEDFEILYDYIISQISNSKNKKTKLSWSSALGKFQNTFNFIKDKLDDWYSGLLIGMNDFEEVDFVCDVEELGLISEGYNVSSEITNDDNNDSMDNGFKTSDFETSNYDSELNTNENDYSNENDYIWGEDDW